MKFKTAMRSGFAIFMFTSVGAAQAYTLITCNGQDIRWDSDRVTMHADDEGFPEGSTWASALRNTIYLINQNPSDFNFSLEYGAVDVGLGNGRNEIWWSENIGAPSIANWWMDCYSGRFIEADVRVDPSESYSTNNSKFELTPYGGDYRPFRTTAMHELGHVMGLGHTSSTYSLMGQDWDHIHANGSYVRAYFGEDAGSGAAAIYGNKSDLDNDDIEDLSVSHWRWSGSQGEYSTHDRTRILSADGEELASTPYQGEPRYSVDKGQEVLLEFTYENNGVSYQTTEVGFFVSTNSFISPYDRRIGGRNGMGLGGDSAFTFQAPVTIPDDLVSGETYWVGVVIDEDDTLQEVSETNNRTYIAVQIN